MLGLAAATDSVRRRYKRAMEAISEIGRRWRDIIAEYGAQAIMPRSSLLPSCRHTLAIRFFAQARHPQNLYYQVVS